MSPLLEKLNLPKSAKAILAAAPSVITPSTREEIIALALGGDATADRFNVSYNVPGKGDILEAEVIRASNGVVINYVDPLMRRRDPECMAIGDSLPTDKTKFVDRFGAPFEGLRGRTEKWLSEQDLSVTAFIMGRPVEDGTNYGGILIAPKNAGFFIGGLADLQGLVPLNEIPDNFKLKTILYLAPPFRHTDFNGKQVVVHCRGDVHEVFAYNLYPGPSAKKGVYGALLTIGEQERWLTLHASTVQMETPYGNSFTIMHEGASGAGKSELLEPAHRDEDGRLTVATNSITGDTVHAVLGRTSKLHPLTDDMAIAHPAWQKGNKLVVDDAEKAWFVRVDHITQYGSDPHLEKETIHPKKPLIFLNLKGAPDMPCLIWDHTEDAPGKPCPNPRVILPRDFVHGVRNEPTEVNIRNFGLRAPICTREKPTYGIAGFLHVLPPSLGWLWRLVAPRGHNNPSVTVKGTGMQSEGVGSYWPFATGKMVDHANLLLEQIQRTSSVGYTLTPNQNVGAWQVRFMPQWICREYLARRGTPFFTPDLLMPARCSILGYTPKEVSVDSFEIPAELLRVHEQIEVGTEGYDKGAEQLMDFFRDELKQFLTPDLSPLGRDIIQCVMDGGSVQDFSNFIK